MKKDLLGYVLVALGVMGLFVGIGMATREATIPWIGLATAGVLVVAFARLVLGRSSDGASSDAETETVAKTDAEGAE
jgi:hypothetical protein